MEIEAKKAAGPQSPYRKWMWYSFGAGAASAVFAGVATWVALGYADDYDAGDRSAKKSNKTWSTTAVVGYSAAGALLATGALLWFLEPGQEPLVSAAAGRDGLFLGLSMRW